MGGGIHYHTRELTCSKGLSRAADQQALQPGGDILDQGSAKPLGIRFERKSGCTCLFTCCAVVSDLDKSYWILDMNLPVYQAK